MVQECPGINERKVVQKHSGPPQKLTPSRCLNWHEEPRHHSLELPLLTETSTISGALPKSLTTQSLGHLTFNKLLSKRSPKVKFLGAERSHRGRKDRRRPRGRFRQACQAS